jgi:biopolymer transport protein ExbB
MESETIELAQVTDLAQGTDAAPGMEGAGETATTTTATTAIQDYTLMQMIHDGWYASYPLLLGSVLVLAVAIERFWRYAGIEKRSKELTRNVVEAIAKRDVATANALCTTAKTPLASVFKEGLAWKNIALEDLERVLSTARQEAVAEMRRGLWMLGTIGSLAPFVGLFGTVVGIMKAFRQIAIQGSGGFAVVAAGISEALVATAVGLGVAIVALSFYNYLQVRVGNIGSGWARSAERLVQSLLYVESALQPPSQTPPPASAPEVGRGHPLPA